ncbi:ATP-binding protein [Dactylosporangium cerinum]|uniref:ATP-binding protein n=1 Tax=Dactylosporangium cerinum TaxID=1434730 RepID=A0ABV9WKP6_9ACTN
MSDATAPPELGSTLLTDRAEAASVAALRERVGHVARGHGLADLEVTTFVLVVHELVVNAIRHGGGSARVAIWADPPGLRCRVTDAGRGMPPHRVNPQRAQPADRIRGWGLRLVHRMCAEVDVVTGDGGTRIDILFPIDDHRF